MMNLRPKGSLATITRIASFTSAKVVSHNVSEKRSVLAIKNNFSSSDIVETTNPSYPPIAKFYKECIAIVVRNPDVIISSSTKQTTPPLVIPNMDSIVCSVTSWSALVFQLAA